jgi:hypothetical protein
MKSDTCTVCQCNLRKVAQQPIVVQTLHVAVAAPVPWTYINLLRGCQIHPWQPPSRNKKKTPPPKASSPRTRQATMANTASTPPECVACDRKFSREEDSYTYGTLKFCFECLKRRMDMLITSSDGYPCIVEGTTSTLHPSTFSPTLFGGPQKHDMYMGLFDMKKREWETPVPPPCSSALSPSTSRTTRICSGTVARASRTGA